MELDEEIALKSIKELTSYISRGITPSYTEDEGVVVINQRCIRDNSIDYENARLTDPEKKKIPEVKYLKKYDVLVNSTGVGTLGRVAQIKNINEPTTVDSHVTILRPNDDIDPLYFGYAIQMLEKNIENLAEGSTGQTELSRIRLGDEIFINDLPKNAQKKIGKILSDIDKKIELNKQINHNLEEQIDVLFKSYFVKFDLIDCENFKETIFGDIPEDWEIIELTNILKERNEKSLDQTIQMYSITIDGVRSREETYKKKITAKTTQFKITYKDDIIFGMPNSGYQFGIMEDDIGGVSSAYPVFSINKIPARYVKYFINNTSNYFNDIVKSGSRMGQGIDKNVLLSKEIYIPPKNILNEYYTLEKQYLDIIECNSKEIEKLENLRNTLLPKLMSGEIDVSEINCDL